MTNLEICRFFEARDVVGVSKKSGSKLLSSVFEHITSRSSMFYKIQTDSYSILVYLTSTSSEEEVGLGLVLASPNLPTFTWPFLTV